jgi:hypothetical protein
MTIEERLAEVKRHLELARMHINRVLALIDNEQTADSDNLAICMNDAASAVDEAMECYCGFLFAE